MWCKVTCLVMLFFAGALPGSPTTGPTSGEPVFILSLRTRSPFRAYLVIVYSIVE